MFQWLAVVSRMRRHGLTRDLEQRAIDVESPCDTPLSSTCQHITLVLHCDPSMLTVCGRRVELMTLHNRYG